MIIYSNVVRFKEKYHQFNSKAVKTQIKKENRVETEDFPSPSQATSQSLSVVLLKPFFKAIPGLI